MNWGSNNKGPDVFQMQFFQGMSNTFTKFFEGGCLVIATNQLLKEAHDPEPEFY